MLDTRFPRFRGDAGCAETWRFPVHYHIVRGGTAARVVRQRADNLLPAFIAGGTALAQQGVAGISTTCGFMCLHQQALARALPLPVMTSALLLAPQLIRCLPPAQKLGILTVSAAHLTGDYLRAAGINSRRIAIGGLAADSHFARVLLDNGSSLDTAQAARDLLAAADTLLTGNNTVSALLLECTNMPPYRTALRRHTGLPVYSIIDAVEQFYDSHCLPHSKTAAARHEEADLYAHAFRPARHSGSKSE